MWVSVTSTNLYLLRKVKKVRVGDPRTPVPHQTGGKYDNKSVFFWLGWRRATNSEVKYRHLLDWSLDRRAVKRNQHGGKRQRQWHLVAAGKNAVRALGKPRTDPGFTPAAVRLRPSGVNPGWMRWLLRAACWKTRINKSLLPVIWNKVRSNLSPWRPKWWLYNL